MVKAKETGEVKSLTNSQTASDEFRDFVLRFESMEVDKKAISDDQKDLMGEAKARGWDTKVMRHFIAERKRDADEVAEEESVLELYRQAFGLSGGGGGGEDGADDDDGMV